MLLTMHIGSFYFGGVYIVVVVIYILLTEMKPHSEQQYNTLLSVTKSQLQQAQITISEGKKMKISVVNLDNQTIHATN